MFDTVVLNFFIACEIIVIASIVFVIAMKESSKLNTETTVEIQSFGEKIINLYDRVSTTKVDDDTVKQTDVDKSSGG